MENLQMNKILKHPLIQQILKFGVVGFLCFFIEYGLLILLREWLGMPVLVANFFAFIVSMLVNYILSIIFVFETDKKKNKVKEFIVFTTFSVGGLLINQFVMWAGTAILDSFWSRSYIIVKPFATGVVMVYNFITRKIFIEKKPEKKAE